jgi:hypothetical protein
VVRGLKHGRTVGLIVALGLCGSAPAAVAAGGPNIASGTLVTPGQQMFGDTSAGEYNCGPADYWNLPLLAGDRARIDWTSLQDSDGIDYASGLALFPAGTTDFSINNVEPAEEYYLGSNHRAESVFAAGTSGTYPMVFTMSGCGGSTPGGPFNFTAYVTHAIVVSMGSVSGLADRRGSVTVRAHRPDGQPLSDPAVHVSLIAAWRGRKPHPVATASPVNGKARLAVKLPQSTRGKKVTLRAVASGTGYRAARSASRKVRVQA